MTVYDFSSYELIWEHQLQCGLGPDWSEHGVMFAGSDATLILDIGCSEVIAESKKHGNAALRSRSRMEGDAAARAADHAAANPFSSRPCRAPWRLS